MRLRTIDNYFDDKDKLIRRSSTRVETEVQEELSKSTLALKIKRKSDMEDDSDVYKVLYKAAIGK